MEAATGGPETTMDKITSVGRLLECVRDMRENLCKPWQAVCMTLLTDQKPAARYPRRTSCCSDELVMRVRYWLATIVVIVAGLLAIDAAVFRGHYRRAAWHEFQVRAGLLHKKTEHPKKRTAVNVVRSHLHCV
jgi:hypothetical protein